MSPSMGQNEDSEAGESNLGSGQHSDQNSLEITNDCINKVHIALETVVMVVVTIVVFVEVVVVTIVK